MMNRKAADNRSGPLNFALIIIIILSIRQRRQKGANILLNRSFLEFPVVFDDVESFHTEPPDRRSHHDAAPSLFDQFEIKYLHYHNILEIGYCYEGSGICLIEGVEQPFSAGDAQIIFPYQAHLSKSASDAPSWWNWLNVDLMAILMDMDTGMTVLQQVDDWINREIGLSGIIYQKDYPEITRLLHSVISEASRRRPHWLQMCGSLMYELLIHLSRISDGSEKRITSRNMAMACLSPALERVRQDLHVGRRTPVSDLAELCNMSVSHFRRIFHSAVGMSPRAYIQSCAIRNAQFLLLSSSQSILQIALGVGFQDISSFSRCFSQYCGISPSAFRRRGQSAGQDK
jgi:AraC family transcriptional regulator, activator of mtrCDE